MTHTRPPVRLLVATQLQEAASVAANAFQLAQEQHHIARKAVRTLEEDIESGRTVFTAHAQTELSARVKCVALAESQRERAYAEFCRLSDDVQQFKTDIARLASQFKRAIAKAKPYMEARERVTIRHT